MSLKEFQRYCLNNNIPFVSYIMPGERKPVSLYVPGRQLKTFKSLADMDVESGFLMAPFQSENLPLVVIPDQFKIMGWDVEIERLPSPKKRLSPKKLVSPQPVHISTLSEYSAQVSEIKSSIYRGKSQKVVLSRIKEFDDLDIRQLPDVFEELANQYLQAFVYLLYTPYTGVWLGATPETLLHVDRRKFSTMALAGTKVYNGPLRQEEWTMKEIREQEYVTSYMRRKLSLGGYRFRELERQNVRAGNVEHLMTMFEGEIKDTDNSWKDLVQLLYPTPAICGTDDEATLPLIQKVEKHKREYYTGYMGPYINRGQANLFINLRCMKMLENTAYLYAGGGILGESSVLKEWAETDYKLQTLIRVIQKVAGKGELLKMVSK
jgi:isochorismate synthase